jgi:hypothetical protein
MPAFDAFRMTRTLSSADARVAKSLISMAHSSGDASSSKTTSEGFGSNPRMRANKSGRYRPDRYAGMHSETLVIAYGQAPA